MFPSRRRTVLESGRSFRVRKGLGAEMLKRVKNGSGWGELCTEIPLWLCGWSFFGCTKHRRVGGGGGTGAAQWCFGYLLSGTGMRSIIFFDGQIFSGTN